MSPQPYYQRRHGFLPPGSDDARAEGCICPVLDNNHGRFPVYPPDEDYPDGGWYVRTDCPIHQEFEEPCDVDGGPHAD